MRLTAGSVLIVAGLAAFAQVIGLEPGLLEGGLRAVPVVGPMYVPFNSEPHLVLLLGSHDLRLAALLAVGCGIVLVLSTFPGLPYRVTRLMLVAASLLAAGTVPLLAGDSAEHPALAPFVPVGYHVVLRLVQVLLIVAALATALAAGRVDRRPATVVIGLGGLLAVLILAGSHSAIARSPFVSNYFPVVPSGLLGVGALFLLWRGVRLPLRTRAVGALVVTAVVVPTQYGWAMVAGLPLSYELIELTGGAVQGADGLPWIGAGVVAGAALLVVHLFVLAGIRPAVPDPAAHT